MTPEPQRAPAHTPFKWVPVHGIVVEGEIYDVMTGELYEIDGECNCDIGHICHSVQCNDESTEEMLRYAYLANEPVADDLDVDETLGWSL